MEEIEADEWYNASAITYDNTQTAFTHPTVQASPPPALTTTLHNSSPGKRH